MRQSRLMSLVEAVANVVVGYGVAVLVQIAGVPAVRARRHLAAEPRDRARLHRGLDRAELPAATGLRGEAIRCANDRSRAESGP